MRPAVIALLPLLLVSCGDEQGELRIGGGSLTEGVGQAVGVEAGSTFLVGALPICPEGGPVTLTGVSTYGGDDIEVTGYAVRRNPFLTGGSMLADAPGTLESNGLERADDAELDQECGEPDSGEIYELIVELRASDTDQQATGYRVSYGDGDELDLEVRLTTCVDGTADACDILEDQ